MYSIQQYVFIYTLLVGISTVIATTRTPGAIFETNFQRSDCVGNNPYLDQSSSGLISSLIMPNNNTDNSIECLNSNGVAVSDTITADIVPLTTSTTVDAVISYLVDNLSTFEFWLKIPEEVSTDFATMLFSVQRPEGTIGRYITCDYAFKVSKNKKVCINIIC